jgi:hypothetical protein
MNVPLPAPKNTPTESEPWLAVTKSRYPSALKSLVAMQWGLSPVEAWGTLGNAPLPSPNRMLIEAEALLVDIKSKCLSLLLAGNRPWRTRRPFAEKSRP